jgi:hypothetical protein
LATTAEDDLHIYGGRGGGKVTNQLRSLGLPGMIREPRRHLMEVLAIAELQHGTGNTGSLPDFGHHRTLVVLH